MGNEKRLIDAIELANLFGFMRKMWSGSEIMNVIHEAETVDAVEVEKYNRLVEAYHQLRENFVDFVCSGIPNVAPYCLNRCDGCCDAYGWCRQSNLCQGFNPAEVILDGERKDNEITE